MNAAANTRAGTVRVLAFVPLPMLFALIACAAPPDSIKEHDEKVLRIVPQSDLEILDTVWSTAAVPRNHGYMIYDTLFGMDSRGKIAPQMVDTYEVSSDRKTWTFTLRPGLECHDGTMVTSDDVLASLQRWTQRDTMGLVMRSFVERWEVADANTFRILLKEPYGMMLETLGKVAGSAPFIMPKRVSEGRVLVRHALANAAVPIVTTIGIGLAILLGGVVVTESVFSIPGLGRLTVEAVLAGDFPTVQGVILLFSVSYVTVNLLIDLSYPLFDPRIRY